IRDNDADIRAVAVSVYHFPLYQLNFNCRILSHFAFIEKRIYGISSITHERKVLITATNPD
ncbi:MAG: hypothetical protein Q7U37_02500, partial [Gallionella sp.]|nr:hypothetical protein [Gallionella sp.]